MRAVPKYRKFCVSSPIKIAEGLSSDTYHCLSSRCSCTIRQMTFGRLRRGGCPRRERTTSWPCGGTASTFAADGESKVNEPLRRKYAMRRAAMLHRKSSGTKTRARARGCWWTPWTRTTWPRTCGRWKRAFPPQGVIYTDLNRPVKFRLTPMPTSDTTPAW